MLFYVLIFTFYKLLTQIITDSFIFSKTLQKALLLNNLQFGLLYFVHGTFLQTLKL